VEFIWNNSYMNCGFVPYVSSVGHIGVRV